MPLCSRSWQALAVVALVSAPGAFAAKTSQTPRPSSGSRKPKPANAAPVKKPAAAPVPKVEFTGQLSALIRGERVPITVLGDLRTLDVILERKSLSQGVVRLKGSSDARGAFSVKDVPHGKYLLRVRIPETPAGQDIAELYRGEVEINAERAAAQLQTPYLVMRATENGAPLNWDRLVVNVRREGGELKQSWNLIFQKEPGASPTGPVEEKGGVIIHIEKQNGQVNFGYSWSSKDKNLLMFPVVEEDVPVRYYMSLGVPKRLSGYRRFEARRGGSPAELDFPMEPFRKVAGSIALQELSAELNAARVGLTVYDPVDKVAIFSRGVTADADGSFTFEDVPAGLAWISATIDAKREKGGDVSCSTVEWATLGVKPADGKDPEKLKLLITPESGKATSERFRQMQEFKPSPEPPAARPPQPEKGTAGAVA